VKTIVPPLFGLVLAGGRGSRLGRDKASLDYHGVPQLRWALNLLARHCERVLVSARDVTQTAAAPFSGVQMLTDAPGVTGPAAGLAAAFRFAPDAAWLLVAVDMPLVEDATLATLISNRDPEAVATAYRHVDGTPEPLCAIWEPAAADRLPAQGAPSLRRLLDAPGARLLVPAEPLWLKSVNTESDDRAVRALLEWRRAGHSTG